MIPLRTAPRRRYALIAALAAGALACGGAAAQDRTEPVPKQLARVGVDEKLDAALPLELLFKDDAGRDVSLGSYFRPGRPVVLTLNYYRCPMLCTLELNGLVSGMKQLAWTAGDEFDVVTVSFDPRETPALARAKKQSYLEDLARPSAERGWHFLTGSSASIETLTKAVGFSTQYDPQTDQYGHAAAVMIATPEGRVARYLYGVRFEPATLKLALLEASKGKIGSTWERFILYCYHYDADQGRYALAAMSIMRVGGALTVLVLSCVIGGFWLRDRRKSQAA
jgi:protein SCO1/2